MIKKNNAYIDTIRGFAIFLMLWSHVLMSAWANSLDFFDYWLTKLILSCNMPLFMLVSGYLFFQSAQKKPYQKLMGDRLRPLSMTIFFCGILYWFFTKALGIFLEGGYGIIVSGEWIDCMDSFWFLWSVIACSFCMGSAYKITEKVYLQILLLILFVPILFFLPYKKFNIYMYIFFIIGFYYHKYKDSNFVKKIYKFRYICILLFPVMLIFYRYEHFIYFWAIYNTQVSLLKNIFVWWFRYAIGLVGSIAFLTIFKLIYDVILKDKIKDRVFVPMGKNSLELYTLSCIFLSHFYPIIINALLKTSFSFVIQFIQSNLFLYSFIFSVIVTIVYAILLQLLIKLLDKTKVNRIIFGKKSTTQTVD